MLNDEQNHLAHVIHPSYLLRTIAWGPVLRNFILPSFMAGLMALLCMPAMSQSLANVSIGGDVSALKALGSQPYTSQNIGPFTIARYNLSEGKTISATYNRENGRIEYLEADWGGTKEGAQSDFRGFTYGVTTLGDIRKLFGSDGIAFKDAVKTNDAKDGGILVYNSYEV